MRFIFAFLFCVFVGAANLSVAQTTLGTPLVAMSAKDLLAHCKSQDVISLQVCRSYISGILDYHNLILTLGSTPTVNFCIPANVPMEHLNFLVMDYLDQNSQHDDFSASPAVIMALYQEYPCP